MPHAHGRPVVVTVRTRPSPEQTTSTTTSSSSRQVHFSPSTTTSRPLNAVEQWSLYNFEMHARSCQSCFGPMTVFRAGRHLCAMGHSLCADLATHIKREDGEFYCSKSHRPNLVRLEVPPNYGHTIEVLRVMEKQLKKIRRDNAAAAAAQSARADSVLDDAEATEYARKRERSPRRRHHVIVNQYAAQPDPRAAPVERVERRTYSVVPDERRDGRWRARYHCDKGRYVSSSDSDHPRNSDSRKGRRH